MKKSKVISLEAAASLVKDGATLGIQGVITSSVPVDLMTAVRDRYVKTGAPKTLTVYHESGIGDGKDGGMNMFAEDGLIGKLVCGHIGTSPKLFPLITANKFPTFVIPQGVLVRLTRAIGSHQPGFLTSVGLKTFADPRVEGCKANQAARDCGDEVVEVLDIHGKDFLLYKSFPIDICFIRGTTSDVDGNISIEKEAVRLCQLEMATATHNSGGIVIAQVERLTEAHTIKPHDVLVPGVLVDYVVLGSEVGSRQCFGVPGYFPEWSGETRLPLDQMPPMPLSERKICGRRAAFELREGNLVNLGIGMPEAMAGVAAEEGVSPMISLGIEVGTFGGVPAGGLGIGASTNVEAILGHAECFDIYDGGGIDLTVLGAAEIDKFGNVNVSKFAGRTVGPGGFVNITQSTSKIVFVGTFMAGKVGMEIKNGALNITDDGKASKFVQKVEQITFSGEYANDTNKDVLYVTERAVFKLTPLGVELIEIAPGIDLEKHILSKMAFTPIISKNLKTMDARIFRDAPMNLKIAPRLDKAGSREMVTA
jgi:propionate CoA-transferase